MLGMSNGQKMAEFISFFVSLKEALDKQSGFLPAFVSSRVSHIIDEKGERNILLRRPLIMDCN